MDNYEMSEKQVVFFSHLYMSQVLAELERQGTEGSIESKYLFRIYFIQW